ncbi:hypothetical protein C8R43DRAFT_1142686 [Mycena crocata]|nr:hypothetical protein C8R43DRAFT_1142686 [Mycena crocata]
MRSKKMPSSPSSLFTPPPEDEDSDEEDQLVDDVEIADSYCAPTPSADLSDSSRARIVSYNRTESSASLVHVPRNVPLRSRMMSNGFLSNPTAQEFKDGDCSRYLSTSSSAHFNLVDLGKVYGLNHNPIRKAVLNAYRPPDNIDEDPSYLPEDILRTYCYLPPIPLKQSPVRRKAVTPTPRRISQSSTTQRATRSRAKPSQPRQFHQPDAPDGEEHSQGKRQRAVEDDRVGRAAKITKTSTMHPPPSLVEEHPLPRGAVPPSSAEDMEPHVPIATPLPSGSAPPSQLPHSSSMSVDAALQQFLSNVRLFNMSEWSQQIVETGFKSMRQVRTLAAYSKADLKETIDDLFKLPEGGMTKLERVSLMNAIADLERKKRL